MKSEDLAEIAAFECAVVKRKGEIPELSDYRVITIIPYLNNAWFDGSQQEFADMSDDLGGFPQMITVLGGRAYISHGKFLAEEAYAMVNTLGRTAEVEKLKLVSVEA